MTREQFIVNNPIEEICSNLNIRLKGSGVQKMGKCIFHEDSTESLSVNVKGKVWKCFAGCGGGSVIDLIMKAENLSYAQFAEKYGISKNGYHTNGHTVKSAFNHPPDTRKGMEIDEKTIEKEYSYQDMLGHEVFQVVRFKPKTFRQRHKEGDKWVWNLTGVQRVLYRLPQIIKAQEIWHVEGEKDADSLVDLGNEASTSPGGADSWLDAYAEVYQGKDVVICGDTDKKGQEYVTKVFDSLAGKASTVRIVELPKTVKDVSEYIATFKTKEDAKKALEDLKLYAHPFIKGYRVSASSVDECEISYKQHMRTTESHCLDLGKWLPSFKVLRPLVPGEFMVVIGDTGTGKTAILSSVALASNIPSLFFELELPTELMFERLVAARHKITCREVEKSYRNGEGLGKEALRKLFPNLYVCTEGGLTLDEIASQISRAELKMGVRPSIVYIDYLQLIKGGSNDRYERMSNIAEGIKLMAKQLRVIVVAASQIHRPKDEKSVVGLHSAKDSGAIENSAGVVISADRSKEDPMRLNLKVQKSTKDGGGKCVTCNFDGGRMVITERATV